MTISFIHLYFLIISKTELVYLSRVCSLLYFFIYFLLIIITIIWPKAEVRHLLPVGLLSVMHRHKIVAPITNVNKFATHAHIRSQELLVSQARVVFSAMDFGRKVEVNTQTPGEE